MAYVATQPLVDVRADVPVLAREFEGKRVAYLDSAATSQRPEQVIQAMDSFQRESYAPIHRGVYELARESTDRFEAARQILGIDADFLGTWISPGHTGRVGSPATKQPRAGRSGVLRRRP